MNRTLEARIKARERVVDIGDGRQFTISRPKLADISKDMSRIELIKRFTVGWNLKNIDLVPGGVPDPEPFDPQLFADYVEDEEDLWIPLAEAITNFYKEFLVEKANAVKN